ncbi:MAG TPA: hypothetical protein VLX56_09730 [Nitrososphaerales archaeon]|nr:hypothetical protein [Nitrososphaerales archaeon]
MSDEDLSEEKTKCRDMGAFDSMVSVLFAFIMIYVGWEILYPLNPLLAILFILMALFVVFRAVTGGGRGGGL